MSRAFTRRSTPFGHLLSPKGTSKRFQEFSSQLTIREMNFGTGGIGAALWDASIIMSHFVLNNPHIFAGKTVHEVGAGIGLPALYAGFYARHVIISDYLTSLVDNVHYNVQCNVNMATPAKTATDEGFNLYTSTPKAYQHHELWDIIYQNQKCAEKRIEDEENGAVSSNPDKDYPVIDIHEFEANRLKKQREFEFNEQIAVVAAADDHLLPLNPTTAYTADPSTLPLQTDTSSNSPTITDAQSLTTISTFPPNNHDPSDTITPTPSQPLSTPTLPTPPWPASTPAAYFPVNCLNHSSICGCLGNIQPPHVHQLTPRSNLEEITQLRDQCLINMARAVQPILLDWFQFNSMPLSLKKSLNCDIIMGSEVCYPTILDAFPSLASLIHQTLSDTGVFYLIQSPNRGTAIAFIEELCTNYGFLLHMRSVPASQLDLFRSGQREESYVYYTFARPNSVFPIMGLESDLVAPPNGLSAKSLALINTYTKKHQSDGSIVGCEVIIFDPKLAQPL